MKGYKAISKHFEVQESTSEKHLTIANNYYSFQERTSHIIHLKDRAYVLREIAKNTRAPSQTLQASVRIVNLKVYGRTIRRTKLNKFGSFVRVAWRKPFPFKMNMRAQ